MERDGLTEIKAIKNLLGTLFGRSSVVQTQRVSPSDVESHAKDLIKKVIRSVGADTVATERQKMGEGVVIRFKISVGSRKFWLKCYVVFESRYFNLTLWSGDRQNLLDVLAIGDLRKNYRLRAMASMRLEPWAKGEK